MTTQDPTRLLIAQAQQGDKAAFDELIQGYRARLESFVHSRLGEHLKPSVDAEDVLQEMSIWAFKSLQRFQWRGTESFMHWLCSIAEHVILKAASRKKREQEVHIDSDLPGTDVSPSRHLRRNERFDRLQETMNRLSADYREVILLARIEGLRIEEIARRMNRSPEAAKKLLRRGLKKLREGFGETESLHLPDRSLRSEEARNGE